MVENPKSYHAPMHTAEHILNQTMVRMFGIERSFSNHIERKKSKCDYYFDRALTDKEIDEINRKVNEIIAMDLPVNEVFMLRKEAEKQFVKFSFLAKPIGRHAPTLKLQRKRKAYRRCNAKSQSVDSAS